jgi:hypothetical protein
MLIQETLQNDGLERYVLAPLSLYVFHLVSGTIGRFLTKSF